MSGPAPSRLMLRHTRLIARNTTQRFASTTEAAKDAAAKSKETASNATSQASQGLSRVSSSAGSALSGAAQRATTLLGRIGGRTGRLISLVESMIPPTIYYSKVGFELSKLVFRGQKMSPPDLASFQKYTQPLVKVVRNPAGILNKGVDTGSSYSPEAIFSRVRNLNTQQMVTAGVVGAEVIGFFTIGEMMGRMKLVGYRGDEEHHETATNTH
ncbi:ATP synthase subunit G atp20 [Lecanora helva]